MRFGILGPLEVIRDVPGGCHRVDVGGPKQQALLSLFLVHHGRFVTSDWLIDALWDGRPPASAETTLRTYVAGLRRALEPTRGARATATILRSRHGGYELCVAAEDVDAVRCAALAESGRIALDAGDARAAEEQYLRALELYRGDPLSTISDLRAAQPETNHLVELRFAIEEGRFAAAVEAGRHSAVLAQLARFVTEQPARETARAQLMLALYRDGRQAEALAAYDEGRRILAEEYGLDPGAALRHLQTMILAQVDAPGSGGVQPAAARLTPLGPERRRLVGRAAELATLNEGLAAARSDGGRVAVISGDPGIGKTSIATALGDQADAQGIPVVVARCPEVGQAPPFWVWTRIVRVLSGLPGAGPAASSPALNAIIGSAIANERPALGTGAPLDSAARFRLYEAVGALIEAAAAENGLVLILDDLHAADADSLLLLRFLATSLPATRAFLVAAVRPYGHLPDVVAAVNELSRDPRHAPIPLSGLALEEIGKLAHLEVGSSTDDAYLADLLARTGGNPFFVTELLRHTAPSAGEALPPTIFDAVRRRLGGLALPARECLDVLAVAGHEVSLEVLASVLECPPTELVDRLSDGQAVALTGAAGPGVVTFRHPLFAEVVYADLAPARRAVLHADLAAAGVKLGTFAAAEIAYHFGQAIGLGHGDDHVQWCLRAADEAIRRLAFRDGMSQLDRAATHLADRSAASPEAAAVELTVQLRRAALLQATAGIGSEAVNSACVRARWLLSRVGAEVDIRPALWTLAEIAANRAEFGICAELAAWIAEVPAQPDDIALAAGRYQLGVVDYFTGRLAEADDHLSSALELLRKADERTLGLKVGQHPALAAYNFRALVRSLRGDPDAARADLDAATRVADRLDDPYAKANAHLYRAWMAMQEGDAPQARTAATRCRDLGAEHDLPHFITTGSFLIDWADVRLGDASRLEDLRNGYDQIYRLGLRATRSITLAAMAGAHASVGDHPGARRLVAEGIAIAEEVGEHVALVELLRLRGELDGDTESLRAAAHLAKRQGAVLLAARLPASAHG